MIPLERMPAQEPCFFFFFTHCIGCSAALCDKLDLDFFDKHSAFLYPSLILSRTRDRRSASEILLSILVAVDRLTSFGSVRRRCTKAPRKQPMGGIESSASKRIPDELEPWAAPPFSSSLDRALPSQTLLHRALLGK